MTVPQETMQKMINLPSEKMAVVIQLVDQLAASPLDIFDDLRNEGIKNPMSDEEVDDFVDSVKQERHAASC